MSKPGEIAVIFDMDGVIVHNHDYHLKAWREFAKRYNITADDEKLTEMFGGTNEEILPELFGRSLHKEELNSLAEEKELLYREIYLPHMTEHDGLTAFLNNLQQSGVVMAVATSAPPVNADFVLDTLQIRHFFKYITTASDISKGKPDPEIYLLTAKRLGITPQQCVVIEDSVRGIKSGLAAGMKVIGVATTNEAGLLVDAHAIIESFDEIDAVAVRMMIN